MSFLEQEAKKRLEEIKNKIFQLWDNRDTEKIDSGNFLNELVRPYLEEMREDGTIYQFLVKNPGINFNADWPRNATSTTAITSPAWIGSNTYISNNANTNGWIPLSENTTTSLGAMDSSWEAYSNANAPIGIVSSSFVGLSSGSAISFPNLTVGSFETSTRIADFTTDMEGNIYEVHVRLDDSYHVCVISFEINKDFIRFKEDLIQS